MVQRARVRAPSHFIDVSVVPMAGVRSGGVGKAGAARKAGGARKPAARPRYSPAKRIRASIEELVGIDFESSSTTTATKPGRAVARHRKGKAAAKVKARPAHAPTKATTRKRPRK